MARELKVCRGATQLEQFNNYFPRPFHRECLLNDYIIYLRTYEKQYCVTAIYCDNCQNHVSVLTTESIFSESAPQIKALDRNLSAFTTLFAPGKRWDSVRTTTAPYTESRLAHLVRNKCVGFPVVEQSVYLLNKDTFSVQASFHRCLILAKYNLPSEKTITSTSIYLSRHQEKKGEFCYFYFGLPLFNFSTKP